MKKKEKEKKRVNLMVDQNLRGRQDRSFSISIKSMCQHQSITSVLVGSLIY